MKRIIVGFLAVCMMLSAGIVMAAEPQKEAAAEKAALEWLAIVDAGRYDMSWTMASDYFKNVVTAEQWVQAVKGVRNPLGAIDLRIKREAIYQTALPGAPDGEYFLIQFDASFKNKKSAVETVTVKLEADGQWRVAGYLIN